MEKLYAVYYNCLSAYLCAPGERLQVCLSLDPLLPTGSDVPHGPDMHLAKMMDNVPQPCLLSVQERPSYQSDQVDSLPSGEKRPLSNQFLRGAKEPSSEVIELTNGLMSFYTTMVSDLEYPKGAMYNAIIKGAGKKGWNAWLHFSHKWTEEHPENPMSGRELPCLRAFLAEKYTGFKADEVETAFKQDQSLPEQQAADLLYDFWKRSNPVWSSFYGTTYQEVFNAVSHGASLHAKMDSTLDSDVKQTWANGIFGVNYEFFSVSGEAKYAKLNEKVVSSRITMTLDIAHYATIPVKESRGSWFLKSILDMARNNPAMFRSGSFDHYKVHFNNKSDPAWGDLVWFTDKIILAKDVNVTMRIHTEFTEMEFEQFQQAATYGFWPFFAGNESSGWSDAKVSKDGNEVFIEIKTADKDHIFLLGTKVGYVFEM